jgi:hypothetical protein
MLKSKSPSIDSALDSPDAQAGVEELPTRYHSVLMLGQSSDAPLPPRQLPSPTTCLPLTTHMVG